MEIDTSNAGMMDCSHQAYILMQQTPSLRGSTRCSFFPTKDALPYGYKAHIRLDVSDGFKPSSPYLTRTATREACNQMLRATSAMEKTVILENLCETEPRAVTTPQSAPRASPQSGTAAPSPSKSLAARLRELDELKKDRLISEAEYLQKRKALLDAL